MKKLLKWALIAYGILDLISICFVYGSLFVKKMGEDGTNIGDTTYSMWEEALSVWRS